MTSARAARHRRTARVEAGHSVGDHVHVLTGIPVGDLDLVDFAQDAAETLAATHPQVVFTSGRRSVAEQATAMAANVVVNRRWIEQTYAASAERTALQAWVDANPQATTKVAIANGLRTIMDGWDSAQLGRISLHMSGQAFDVQPMGGALGAAVKQTIGQLARLDKFLTQEGGLIIWHAQFR